MWKKEAISDSVRVPALHCMRLSDHVTVDFSNDMPTADKNNLVEPLNGNIILC